LDWKRYNGEWHDYNVEVILVETIAMATAPLPTIIIMLVMMMVVEEEEVMMMMRKKIGIR
jgi:hypothetical protein